MPSDTFIERAVRHALSIWPLVVVPILATVLDIGRLRTLLAHTDRTVSVTFGIPRPVSSLWSFVNAQPSGVSIGPASLDGILPIFAMMFLGGVVSGLLAAAYLGSIEAALDDGLDIARSVRRYGLPLVAYSLLEAVVGLLVFLPALASRALLPVAVVVIAGLAYLFFAAPYLVVVADLRLLEALRRAARLATTEASVLVFFLGYVSVSAVVSVPVSWVAFRGPPVGVGVAILLAAPVALLLNVATLLFVRDLVAAQSPGSNRPVER